MERPFFFYRISPAESRKGKEVMTHMVKSAARPPDRSKEEAGARRNPLLPCEIACEIACSFPALRLKGAHRGAIPGIAAEGIDEGKLSSYLYEGSGAPLSRGEALMLEFVLNLLDPYSHTRFNLGIALRVLSPRSMDALIAGIVRFYSRE